MSVLAAALISFLSFALITWHIPRSTMRAICGYALVFDIILHGGVIWLFIGTSTLGLLQAELSAILITCALRAYRFAFGYRKLSAKGWVSYPGFVR